MWSANLDANALLMVHVVHGDLDVDAVVAVVIAVAERSGLGSHARDTLTFLYLSYKYRKNGWGLKIAVKKKIC